MSAAVCLRARIVAGSLPALRAALAAADADCRSGASGLAQIAGVHFARFMIVPGPASLTGDGTADSLVYTADTDTSVGRHLHDLDVHAGSLLDSLFGHCAGYRVGAGGAPRRAWLREHRVASAATYLNTLAMSVERIGIETRAYDWIQAYLDAHRSQLVAQRPSEIHARVRSALATAEPDLASALTPAAAEPLPARLGRWTVLIGAVVLAILLLPVLIVVGVPWLLALRRLERRDPSDSARADRAQVEQLRAREDAFALNPFGALGVVKPGALRAVTVKLVLVGIAIAASTIFVRGSLAGVTTIHVARWVPLDGGRRMIFTSCYDGSLESYMNDFIDKLAWGLNVIFSNGVGYPRTRWLIFDGARDEQTFKDYLRRHQLEAAVSYAAHPTLTAANVRTNAAVRRGLAQPALDDERAAAWLALL